MSVILSGEDYLALELRTSTTIAMIRHRDSITEAAISKGLHLGFQIDYLNQHFSRNHKLYW